MQNIPFGLYGYGAYVNRLADELTWTLQNLRDWQNRQRAGMTEKNGVLVEEIITRWQAKYETALADYDRAKAEA